MLIHPQFDPIAFSIGPLGVHWYGLMYLLGFLAFWLLGRRRAQDYWRGVTPDDVENLLFWGVFGVVLGGRLGYCLFYQPAWYLTHPLQIFSVWQGGMSAHGGLLGVLIVMALYVRRHGMRFWQLTDFVAPLVPLGLFFGRIGNFINGELWGRPASPDLPWAMIFPQAQDGGISRHPSQLYEAGLEGLALFVVIWLFPQAETGRQNSRFICLGLWGSAVCERILPRTRCVSWIAGIGAFSRTVAYAAADSRRADALGLGGTPAYLNLQLKK